MVSPEAKSLLFFSTIIILLLAKVIMLMVSGPMAMPDTGAYHSFAETILSDRSWITNADLAGGVEPPTAYRMVGYPALIALAIFIVWLFTAWGAFPLNLVVLDEIAVRDAQYAQIGALHHQVIPISFYGLQEKGG